MFACVRWSSVEFGTGMSPGFELLNREGRAAPTTLIRQAVRAGYVQHAPGKSHRAGRCRPTTGDWPRMPDGARRSCRRPRVSRPSPRPQSPGGLPWATMLRCVFAIEVLVCPRCGGARSRSPPAAAARVSPRGEHDDVRVRRRRERGLPSGYGCPGTVNVKVEPLPISLVTQIRPPCSSTNFLVRVSPSPVPSCRCAPLPT